MKVILEFNLPEEQARYDVILRASDFYDATSNYIQWLHAVCNYSTPDSCNAHECRDKFFELLSERIPLNECKRLF
jgi:hypothetical protein